MPYSSTEFLHVMIEHQLHVLYKETDNEYRLAADDGKISEHALPTKVFFDFCNASYLKQDGQNDNGYAVYRLTPDAQSLKKTG